jgi:PAS domain S-box-containing protein
MIGLPALISADEIVGTVLVAVRARGADLSAALDKLPAAIYVTDPNGFVTYFNPACIDFTGRHPGLGQDRWCVTWKLYTEDGEFLPHAQCPMAVAIQTKKPVRGVTAIAERPNGTRVRFLPFPTPLFDDEGALKGAVNILIDLTDSRQADFLESQARKCRRLARFVGDTQTFETLSLMACEYEDKARLIRAT